jgi:hypothetical protein
MLHYCLTAGALTFSSVCMQRRYLLDKVVDKIRCRQTYCGLRDSNLIGICLIISVDLIGQYILLIVSVNLIGQYG